MLFLSQDPAVIAAQLAGQDFTSATAGPLRDNVSTDPADLRQAMEKQLGLPAQVADAMATGVFPTSVTPTEIQRVADLMLQFGQLKTSFDVKTMIGS